VTNRALQGSYLVLEPPPICPHALLGLEPDRRFLWKPPKLEKLKRHSIDVISLRNGGMSRPYSPGFEMAITPFDPSLDPRPPLSGLEPDRRPHWKPFNVEMRERYATCMHVVSTWLKKSSLAHLAPLPSTRHTARARFACYIQPSGFKQNRWQYWKLPDMTGLEQRSVVRLRKGGMSRCYSPRLETALTLLIPLLYPCGPHEPWDMMPVQ
jgi:hypothetical protein